MHWGEHPEETPSSGTPSLGELVATQVAELTASFEGVGHAEWPMPVYAPDSYLGALEAARSSCIHARAWCVWTDQTYEQLRCRKCGSVMSYAEWKNLDV